MGKKIPTSFSWSWRSILKTRTNAKRCILLSVGKKSASKFWWDPWSSKGSLIDVYGGEAPAITGIPAHASLADVWANESLLGRLASLSPAIAADMKDVLPGWKSIQLFLSLRPRAFSLSKQLGT